MPDEKPPADVKSDPPPVQAPESDFPDAAFTDPEKGVDPQSGDPISAALTDEPIGILSPGAGVANQGTQDGASPADDAALDDFLQQASFDDPNAVSRPDVEPAAMVATESFDLPNFNQVIQDAQVSSIDLLRDVDLNVKIELGRSRMLVEDVLKLGEGSVVELDKLAGDPVDVFVNDRLVARGEVLVLNDNFCVRVNEIVAALRDETI